MQFLVALIGLGVAIDYSLLVVTRWREETSAGRDNDAAVRRAMATAGRSVVFSGVTVAVSLAALVLVPVPFLRSIGLGGLLIPLFSVATTVTLVPVLLSLVGPRLTWPRRGPVVTRSRFWAGAASAVLRRRWLTIAGCVVVLLALASPLLTLSLGSPQLSGLANGSAASGAATDAVDAGVPGGVLRPTEVLVPTRRSPRPCSGWVASTGWPPWSVRRTTRGAPRAARSCRSGPTPTRRARRARPPSTGSARSPPATPLSAGPRPRTPTSSAPSTATRSGWCWGWASSPSCCWPGRCARCGCRSRRWCSTSSHWRRRTAPRC